MGIQTQNPATGKIVRTFEPHSDAYIEAAISRAVKAQQEVASWSFPKRKACMKKLATILENEAEQLGAIVTLEMGKPIKQAVGEVKKCAWVCRYYAENAERHLEKEELESDAKVSYRTFLPLGVIIAIMPWNFPFWQVFRFAAPAIMAGNTSLLKHASNVPQCALACEDMFKRAGFPDGSLVTLLISGSRVEPILRDDRIAAATLTGSEHAGASVASVCGSEIKPTVLELGGSDPFIIMPSADLDKAIDIACKARLQNTGQSCIAGKRFLIHADIYDQVKAKFVEKFKALKIGDPMSNETEIGPLVNEQSYREIIKQVDSAIEDGAKRVFGAKPIEGEGYFFQPGILENIQKESAAYYEEIFGPVMLLFKVHSIDEAIEIANDSPFGLSSVIWTNDENEQELAITQLQAGGTFVNSMSASDPRLPFGGIKKSGYGRELAEEGVRTWSNVKAISIYE